MPRVSLAISSPAGLPVTTAIPLQRTMLNISCSSFIYKGCKPIVPLQYIFPWINIVIRQFSLAIIYSACFSLVFIPMK